MPSDPQCCVITAGDVERSAEAFRTLTDDPIPLRRHDTGVRGRLLQPLRSRGREGGGWSLTHAEQQF